MARPTRWIVARDVGIVLGAGLLVLALIWVAGGFRPAIGSGRPVAVGSVIELSRWQLRVQSAVFTDQSTRGYDTEPVIRIELEATNLSDRTQLAPTERMIGVRVGDQVLTDDNQQTTDTRSYNYDPQVPAPLILDFRWPPEGSAAAPVPPEQVVVIIRDERVAENFVYRDTYVAGNVVATVALGCPDERKVR